MLTSDLHHDLEVVLFYLYIQVFYFSGSVVVQCTCLFDEYGILTCYHEAVLRQK